MIRLYPSSLFSLSSPRYTYLPWLRKRSSSFQLEWALSFFKGAARTMAHGPDAALSDSDFVPETPLKRIDVSCMRLWPNSFLSRYVIFISLSPSMFLELMGLRQKRPHENPIWRWNPTLSRKTLMWYICTNHPSLHTCILKARMALITWHEDAWQD